MENFSSKYTERLQLQSVREGSKFELFILLKFYFKSFVNFFFFYKKKIFSLQGTKMFTCLAMLCPDYRLLQIFECHLDSLVVVAVIRVV